MLDILFVTDFVCPYCLVAKVALEEALKETGIEACIQVQPLELTPEPVGRVDTCHDEVRKKHYQILAEPARSRDVLKVGGVPAIYINGESVCVEKYTKEEMIQILRQGQASAGGGFACGVDGCG